MSFLGHEETLLWSKLLVFPTENFIQSHPKHVCNAKRALKAGRVLSLLDGCDRLSGYPNSISKIGLRHPIQIEAQRPD